jgi:penicillin G amidase
MHKRRIQSLSTINLTQLANQFSLLDTFLGPAGSGIGSNSWAVSGDLTATGSAILANDPHLGIQMPSIWYQNSLHCRPKTETCRVDVAGFSFAGVPEVVIGHNDRIAWGFTNAGPDVMDLYIEKVNPQNPNQYEVNGQWVDFETRTETIQVAGSDPVEITVRSTRHGPVLTESYAPLKDQVDLEDDPEARPFKDKSGVDLPEHYVISLAWTALTPSTPFEAIWGFNLARNWDEFREAASHFHVPAQNLLYADVDGNIGYQMPGDISRPRQRQWARSPSPAGQTNTSGPATFLSRNCPTHSTPPAATLPPPTTRSTALGLSLPDLNRLELWLPRGTHRGLCSKMRPGEDRHCIHPVHARGFEKPER